MRVRDISCSGTQALVAGLSKNPNSEDDDGEKAQL